MQLFRTKGRGAKRAEAKLAELERRGGAALESVGPAVRKILREVRKQGDRALLRYARKFDGLASNTPLRVDEKETAAAWEQLDPSLKKALETADANIRAFAQRQLPQSWSF